MSSRLWLVLGLAAALAAIMLGYRFRVAMAGGKALVAVLIIGVLVWLALRQRSSRDLDGGGEHGR